jgi:hypothetical protein
MNIYGIIILRYEISSYHVPGRTLPIINLCYHSSIAYCLNLALFGAHGRIVPKRELGRDTYAPDETGYHGRECACGKRA